MHEKPRLAGLFAVSALLAASFPAWAWECKARAVYVHDGDTVTLRCANEHGLVKVRIGNIDAPELHQAYGPEAQAALRDALRDREITIEARAVDRYERVIADLRVGDEDIGLGLVADGLAWCGLRTSQDCTAAQEAARKAGRGLWSQVSPEPPWQWRRAHPRTD